MKSEIANNTAKTQLPQEVSQKTQQFVCDQDSYIDEDPDAWSDNVTGFELHY